VLGLGRCGLVLVCVPRRAGCWGVTEVRPPFISVLFFVSCQVRYGTNKLQPPIEHQEISLQVQMQSSSKTVFGDYRGIHRRTESAYQPTRNMSVFAPKTAFHLQQAPLPSCLPSPRNHLVSCMSHHHEALTPPSNPAYEASSRAYKASILAYKATILASSCPQARKKSHPINKKS
jgi:hypothetical protein